MGLSPKLQALVETARKNHAERLAKEAAAREAAGSATTPANLSPVSKAIATPSISTPHHYKPEPSVTSLLTNATHSFTPTTGVSLNERQTEAVELAMRGKSFNLIGAAGTGKTTTTREVIGQLVRLPHITPIQTPTKWLGKESPGIVVISFTNKAVNNLKKFLPEDLQKHCVTYHKLLQYEPVQYSEDGPFGKKTMRFEPTFNELKPLPHISCVIVEESSMVSDELHMQLLKALPNPGQTQFIFLGDLNQLPPIFGPSILGFKLLDLPTVELTHVYRQALESPIITLAHKIREGRGIKSLGLDTIIDDRGEHGKVTIRPWKKKIESGPGCKVLLHSFLIPLVTSDSYDFNESAILCPFNKSFGTIELNRSIADALAKKRDAEVYEVIARGQRSYWAVGDRVLVDRREAIITRIEHTPGYSGAIPAAPSKTLDRWGNDKEHKDEDTGLVDASSDREIALLKGMEALDSMVLDDDGEGVKNAASHTITVEFVDSGSAQSLSSAGDINGMLFSYVLTVHKSQGSEWKRVFILLHYSHNTMLSRELMYTAITRARHELFIICEPDRGEIYNSLTRAAKSPEISGVTLQEKAQYFKAKKKSMQRLLDRESKKAAPELALNSQDDIS